MSRVTYVYRNRVGGGVDVYEKGTEPELEREQAMHNVLAGDRHYDGLRATDGTPIDSRTKHREYMKRHNLTTVDDFKETWSKAQKQRDEYRTTGKGGAVTQEDIARAIARHERNR
jgi:hypothetical protein